MLQCSHCGMWHHFDCVGLISSDAVGVWPCPRCRQQTSLLNTCHTMLTDINTKMTVLSHLQEGMQKQLSKLESIKTLEQSNLDLVRLLVAKTAECETLRQKLETNKSSPATQTARPRITPTKNILLLGSSIIRDLRSIKGSDIVITSIPGGSIAEITEECQRTSETFKKIILAETTAQLR